MENNMKKIGVLIEFKDGVVKDANYGMITAARGDHHEVSAVIINNDAAAARDALAKYGVNQIIDITLSGSTWHPEKYARAAVSAMEQFGINTLLGLTTHQGRDLLPRIAATLDAPLVMDCLQMDIANSIVETTQYSGKTVAKIQVTGDCKIYGIRPNTLPATPLPAQPVIRSFDSPDTDFPGMTVLETKPGKGDGVDLAEADIIISGGRGMKNGENFKILHDCAKQMGATVGASRVAVDEGWVPYTFQVGQTGLKVNPKVYIACGISGSIQHFAGMKSSEYIIAVNTDENAAIMGKCDYYVVGDIFEIIPALTRELQAKGG